jgi:hypothetical protein
MTYIIILLCSDVQKVASGPRKPRKKSTQKNVHGRNRASKRSALTARVPTVLSLFTWFAVTVLTLFAKLPLTALTWFTVNTLTRLVVLTVVSITLC